MDYNLKKHMLLYCANGETVVLEGFTDSQIWVKYKGKIYDRPITIINYKLFYDNPCAKTVYLHKGKVYNSLDDCQKKQLKNDVKTEKLVPSPEMNASPQKSCRNCRFQISGECSSWDLCDDYQPVYKLSKSETDYWPREGDATRFKKHGRKK